MPATPPKTGPPTRVVIFAQNVWGYSPLKTGIAFLPVTAMTILASGIASQAVPRIGARPLMIAGSVIMAGGMFWLSRITEHSSYADGLLALIIALAAIRVTRGDLSGVDPLTAPAD